MRFLYQPKTPFLSGDKYQPGYIALISVLVVSALGLLLASGASLFSIVESGMALGESQAKASFYLADFCAEQAIMKLESVLNYNGDETLVIGDDSCQILLLEGSGNFNRIVKAQSSFLGQIQKVRVEIAQVSPVLIISFWQRTAQF